MIKNAEQKSIPHLHEEMKQLTEKAQNNECEVSDLRGGTFTISNVGPIGGFMQHRLLTTPKSPFSLFIRSKIHRLCVTKQSS
ncbi:dihydrolipoamide acyltransferase component of branched-chain alpha-keto acid dehydrogenase complex [Geomicrobium sp. JCM 19037]|nr:dihydrolipoamide acyltransferase component of branched-chain alpha-keto acid dehydrogenase complex [Geomicrobium sp. JCM 19037]